MRLRNKAVLQLTQCIPYDRDCYLISPFSKDLVLFTYGALHSGYRYAVAILVALDTAVANASTTALFALGRATVAETQGRMSWKTEKDPIAWRNMAKYRGPV